MGKTVLSYDRLEKEKLFFWKDQHDNSIQEKCIYIGSWLCSTTFENSLTAKVNTGFNFSYYLVKN